MTSHILPLLLCLPFLSDGAQILAFFPITLKSHQFVFQPLLRGLAEKGHQITYVTSTPMRAPHKNIREILIGTPEEIAPENAFEFRFYNQFLGAFSTWKSGIHDCDSTLSKPVIRDFIQQKSTKFDVIIAEISFHQECFMGLGLIFDAPIIDFTSHCGSDTIQSYLFNPNIYSYVTEVHTAYSDRMSLFQRLRNTILGVYRLQMEDWYYLPQQEDVLYSHFNVSESSKGRKSLKHMLVNNIVAAILNTDPVLGYPRPLMPNTVTAAGISVQSRKPLPENLQKFMDEAENGVIYFSFGSILAVEKMPSPQKEYFIEAVKRLSTTRRILWKNENASDTEISPNVLTQKWFPQVDVLSHPNCRLFITHGGYLSLVETVDAGVPVVVVPIFAEQPRNALLSEIRGFGAQLDFDNLSADLIFDTVQKVLNDQSYSKNAKKMSALLKDQVASPLEKAVHMVEYVIRHKGNPNSQTGAKELWWFQYFLLDVIAIILSVTFIVFFALYKGIRFAVTRLIGKMSTKYCQVSAGS